MKLFCLSVQELIVYIKVFRGKILGAPLHLCVLLNPGCWDPAVLGAGLLSCGSFWEVASTPAAGQSFWMPLTTNQNVENIAKCSLISVFPAFWSWFGQDRLTKARLFTWRPWDLWMKQQQLEFYRAPGLQHDYLSFSNTFSLWQLSEASAWKTPYRGEQDRFFRSGKTEA